MNNHSSSRKILGMMGKESIDDSGEPNGSEENMKLEGRNGGTESLEAALTKPRGRDEEEEGREMGGALNL